MIYEGQLGFESWRRILAIYWKGHIGDESGFHKNKTNTTQHFSPNTQHMRIRKANTKLAQEMGRIEEKLYPLDKWHFMVGYTNLDAMREAD